MSCGVGKSTEKLELILQYFRHFTYVTAHSPTLPSFTYVTAQSPTLPLLQLRHSSFSNPSFVSLTSQAPHVTWRAAHEEKRFLYLKTLPKNAKHLILNKNQPYNTN